MLDVDWKEGSPTETGYYWLRLENNCTWPCYYHREEVLLLGSRNYRWVKNMTNKITQHASFKDFPE